MSEPTRHDLNQFLCSRCNQPDAELSGMMVSCDNGRWVSYEDYARLKEQLKNDTGSHRLNTSMWKDEVASLRAENARLRKAGDATSQRLHWFCQKWGWKDDDLKTLTPEWDAAKEGKQP